MKAARSLLFNLMFFACDHPKLSTDRFVEALRGEGVLIGSPNGGVARAVTHLGVSRQDVEKAVSAAHKLLKG